MYREYGSNTSFIDLLFNISLLFVALFAVAFLMMKEIQKTRDIDIMAEYVITVTWDRDSKDDIDTWVVDPLGNEIWYRVKESGIATLDRDDRGNITDTITLPDGTLQVVNINQEIVTIRKAIPGEWAVTLYMYSKRDPTPTKVHVIVQKLNPKNKIIFTKELEMVEYKEEVPIIRMEIGHDGELVDFDNTPSCIVCDRELTTSSTTTRPDSMQYTQEEE